MCVESNVRNNSRPKCVHVDAEFMKRRLTPYWQPFSNASIRRVLTMSLMICFALSSLASIFIVTTSNHLGFVSFREDIFIDDSSIDTRENESTSELSTICLVSLPIEICDNGIDDDGDGLIDCQDSDCAQYDWDGDTVCDLEDIDDDNDGVLDEDECLVTITFEDLTDTRFYSYAQTTSGCRAHHFGELDQGTSNDPSLLFDGDLNTEFRMHKNDFVEFGLGQVVPAGAEIIMEEGSGWEDEKVDIYVSYGSTDPSGDSNTASWSCGGVGYTTAISGGAHLIQQNVNTDNDFTFTVPFDITHVQFRGRKNHAGWGEMRFVSSSQVVFNTTTEFCDTDGDGIANHLDLDSDGDGCSDALESGAANNLITDYQFTGLDANRDGLVDELDADLDGVPNYLSSYEDYALDFNLNGCIDTDSDGIPDVGDIDDDNDGVLDIEEGCSPIEISLGVDGSFESLNYVASSNSVNGNVTAGGWVNGSQSADSWVSPMPTIGSGQWNGTADGTPASPDGGVFVGAWAYNSWGPESFYIDVDDLPIGQLLTLTFFQTHAGVDGETRLGDLARWKVNFGSETKYSSETSYQGESNQIWEAQELSFIPTNASQRLTFTADGGSDGTPEVDYMALDGVVLMYATSASNCVGLDTDGDGVANHLDLDSDGDGCSDAYEAGATNNITTDYQFESADTNNDGLVDELDQDQDGHPNYLSSYSVKALDEGFSDCLDTDNDGVPDVLDMDDDNDGIPDDVEIDCSFKKIRVNEDLGLLIGADNQSGSADISARLGLPPSTVTVDYTNVHVSGVSYVESSLVNTHYTINSNTPILLRLGHGSILAGGAADGFIVDDIDSYDFTSTLVGGLVEASQNANLSVLNTSGGYINNIQKFFWNRESPSAVAFQNTFEAFTTTVGSNAGYTFSICIPADTDGDGVYDYLDLDSDNDGIFDLVEASHGEADVDNNGIIDGSPAAFGANGLFDGVESTAESGVLNYVVSDSDGDGSADAMDLDSDNDDCPDVLEAGFSDEDLDGELGNTPVAANSEGIVISGADGYTSPADSDSNGVDDYIQTGMAPVLGSMDSPGPACSEGQLSFIVNATGADLYYQWQISVDGGINYVNINAPGIQPTHSGYNMAELSLTNIPLTSNEHYYRAIVFDGAYRCDSLVSPGLLLTVDNPMPPIGDAEQTFCADDIPTISELVALGSDVRWYENPIGGPALNSIQALEHDKRYYASQTIASCESDIRLDVLVYLTNPEAPAGAELQYFCTNANPVLLDITTSESLVMWYDALTGGNVLAPNTPIVNGQTYYASTLSGACAGLTRLSVLADLTDVTPPNAVCQAGTMNLGGGTVSLTPADVDGGSTDDCFLDNMMVTPNSLSAVGTYPVILTVTDLAGNTDECSVNILVVDTTAPVAICQDILVYLDSNGDVTINAQDIDGGSTDNGNIVDWSATHTTFDCDDLGANNVTLSVTDDAFPTTLTDDCVATITVLDSIAPDIVCQDIVIQIDAAGNASIDAADIDGGTTDVCGFTLSADITAFDCDDTGDNAVTLTATDTYGNRSVCSAIVTVEDSILPVMTCTPAIIVNNDPGMCGAFVNYTLPGVTDNCSSTVVAQSGSGHSPGDFFPVGTTWVGYFAANPSNGAAATCWFPITVNDIEAPALNCPVNDTVSADMSCQSILEDYTSSLGLSDNCTADGDMMITQSPPAGTIISGTTTVTLTAADSEGNSSNCSFLVILEDVMAPLIDGMTCPGDQTVFLDSDCEYIIEDYTGVITATDNCTSDVSLSIVQDPVSGTVITGHGSSQLITLTATDADGNSSICEFTYTALDTIAPSILCSGDKTQNVDAGMPTAVVNFAVPIGMDNCSGSITTQIDGTGYTTASPFPVGTTTLMYSVTDSAGLTDMCSFDITVIDNSGPEVTCPAPVDVDAPLGFCDTNTPIVIPSPVATDNNGVASLLNDYNNTGDASGVYDVGITVVTWIAADESGNTAICEQIVIVNDVEAPSNLVCPSDTESTATIGECGIDAAFVILDMPTATDPCNNLSISNNAPAYYSAGDTTLVTWTIADTSGNADYCIQEVIILDTQFPVITGCPADSVLENNPGLCNALFTYPLPVAADNCGAAEIVQTAGLESGEAFPIGDTYVEFKITDSNNNMTVCGFTVTVLDTEYPILDGPAVINYEAIEGECEAIVTFDIPVGVDNCPNVITTQTDATGLTSGDLFPVGTTVLTYEAVDASGNMTPLSVMIQVEDVEAPVPYVCPEDMFLVADAGFCGAIINLVSPVAEDNCAFIAMTNDAPALFPIGLTTVTWTIADEAGNTAICALDVTVTDDEAPVITCPNDITTVSGWGECETYIQVPAMDAIDNCAVDSIYNDFNNTEDASGLFPLGTTILTWTAVDVNGNSSECQQTITVNTSGAPNITCLEDIMVGNETSLCGATIMVPQIEVDFDCSIVSMVNDYTGTDDATAEYPVGTTAVTWTATDISGYSSECTVMVTVEDIQAPDIECIEDISVPNDSEICGAYISYSLPAVSDNCGISQLNLVEGVASGGLFNDGTTLVTYQAIDLSGNATSCSFEVTVLDDEAPSISCPENMVVVDSIVNYPYPEFTDNCYAELILTEGPDSGEEFDHGYTEVMLAAVDLNGNMDTCGFQVLVNTPPVAVNDTIILFESDGEIEVSLLDNDYDFDGDSIYVSAMLLGSDLAFIDGTTLFYDIPENLCGVDSVGYIIVDEYGAADTAIVFVEVDCYPNVFVPEGFSPNGDGVNDVLRILGIHDYPDNRLMVFNRWGHKVLDKNGYENDWNGRSEAKLTIGDTYLPRGTYFYILEVGGNIKPLKGFIYINPR